MTPSEKKPSNIAMREAYSIVSSCIYMGSIDMVRAEFEVASALDAAERRGFERAKRMAVELCESLGNTSYSKETRVQIFENLKYEEA